MNKNIKMLVYTLTKNRKCSLICEHMSFVLLPFRPKSHYTYKLLAVNEPLACFLTPSMTLLILKTKKMKASTQYTDFTGYAAADISDYLGSGGGDDLARMAKFFKLDTTRFKIVGISIYGTEDPTYHYTALIKNKAQMRRSISSACQYISRRRTFCQFCSSDYT